nr:hypothetical protein CFP56_31232 [Quercus suber]
MHPRKLSREEEAELARSNKKVKDINHAEFNSRSRASSPSSSNQAPEFTVKTSFKDKLVGEIPRAFAQAFDLTDHMDEDVDTDDENGEASISVHEGQLKIKLSKETNRRTRVRLYSKEDLEMVIKRGPWFVGDHFLSLRPWEPFFKPSTANVSLIAVWIRLNELPIELYETEVLKEIGEYIGKVLRIDSHTAMEACGKYARLYVQIDINRPLINFILISHFEQVEKGLLAPTVEVQESQANGAGDENAEHRKMLPFESTKDVVFSKKQDISPGLSHRVHKSYPSFVKDKKTVARNLASDTPSKSAATSCLEGLARKLTTLSPTSPPSPCFDPK